MPSIRRAIKNKNKIKIPIFLFSNTVVISSFIECMPVESPFPLLSPQSCVCVGVRAGVCACE